LGQNDGRVETFIGGLERQAHDISIVYEARGSNWVADGESEPSII
jgi:hypothetical protein